MLFPGEMRRVSAVYHYKNSSVCGVKVNGKEVAKAEIGVSCLAVLEIRMSSCQAGGKYYKASKAREIRAVISEQGSSFVTADCQVQVSCRCH